MKNRILLVDDNEAFVDTTKDILEFEGFQVVTASNGEDAVSLAGTEPFDIILMDVKMPGMNGVESFIKMKEGNPDIKVILFTAYSLDDLIDRAQDEGACAIFNKPLDMGKFIAAIEKALENGNNACILVADDDQALCDNLSDQLSQEGYSVALACDGKEAIAMAEDKTYDVLLLDMKLPNLNGLEVYRRVKKLQPNLVTIIMTGFEEEMRHIIRKTLDENAYTCLPKPLDLAQLLKLLKEVYAAKKDGTYKKPETGDL